MISGVLEMVAVTAIWGSVSVVAIWSGLPSPAFVFFRVFVAFLALLARYRRVDAEALLDKRMVLSGIFLALNWVLLFYAVSLIPVAEAVMLYYTGPLFAVVAAHLLGERASPSRLALAGIAFAGAVVVVNPLGLGGGPGAFLALASGLFYGLLIVANKLAVRSVEPARLVFYQTAIASAVLAPFALTSSFRLTPSAVVAVLVAAFVNTLLALYLWYDALRKISVQLASVLSYLDPVFAAVFAFIFLGQIPPRTTIIGGALILLSGALTAALEARPRRRG